MSNKIIILASDTTHRRYFIKQIIAAGFEVEMVIFETDIIKPSFETGPFYADEEAAFEKKHFFKDFDDSLANIKVHYVNNINDAASEQLIKNAESRTGVVFGTRFIKRNITTRFSDGLMNVHRGIAQAYRGLDTNLWAIYHEDFSNVGVTIHDVNNVLDTGDVIKQRVLDIPANTEVFQLRYHETVLAAQLTIEAIADHFNDNIQYVPQEQTGRYYSFMPLVIKHTLPAKLKKYLNTLCLAD